MMLSKEECFAVSELAHRLIDAGRNEEAMALVNGLIQFNPEWPWGWYAAGRACFEASDFGRAADFLGRGIQAGAGIEAQMLRLEALVAAGRRDEARVAAEPVRSSGSEADLARLSALGIVRSK